MSSVAITWRYVPVREIAKVIFGGSTPSRNVDAWWNGGIPWVTPGELTRLSGKYLRETSETISKAGLANCGAKLLPPDALMVTTRATLGLVALTVGPISTNQGFKSIVFSGGADPDFYYSLFRTLKPEMERRASGTTFLEISGKQFAEIVVPLPPLPEQRRVAEILDTLADQIRATRRIIAKLKLVKEGLLADLIVRPRPDERLGWSSGELGQFVRWYSGGTPSKEIGKFWAGSIPWLTPKDMKSLVVTRTADSLSPAGVVAGSRVTSEGSVFIVVRGMILAHTFPVVRMTVPASFNQDIKAVVPSARVLPRYLLYWFVAQSDSMLRLVGESTHGTKKIDLPDLKSFPASFPSISDQERIAGILDKQQLIIDLETASLAKLRKLENGLMSDLLTGRVRVPMRDTS